MVREIQIPTGLHIVSKPVGSKCNLNCNYCFYLEKDEVLKKSNSLMNDSILEKYIKNYISSQKTPVVEFVWHGGEPTLIGLEFFHKIVVLQERYKGKKKIVNSIQTNGILIDELWCEFLKKNNFLVGLSLDGPREIHDRYRVDNCGMGSFDKVYKALKFFQKYEVEYNVLACVTKDACKEGLSIYNFFKNEGVKYIQFTPLVERVPTKKKREDGYNLGVPHSLEDRTDVTVTEWTVVPEEYGQFLIEIYEEWIRNDVGEIFVMNFEGALTQWFGNPSPNCIHARQCGRALALENDGSVYACDHYVYPEYKIGNIFTDSLKEIAENSIINGFGREKEEKLTSKCKVCPALNYCFGGCPKHRFVRLDGEKYGHNYLCEGYEKYFRHIQKYLKAMGELITNGYPASYVMEAIKGPLILPKK